MNGHISKRLHRIAVKIAYDTKDKMPANMNTATWFECIRKSVKESYLKLPWNQRHKKLQEFPLSINPALRKRA